MFNELLDPPDHTPPLSAFGAERFKPRAVALMLEMGVVAGPRPKPPRSVPDAPPPLSEPVAGTWVKGSHNGNRPKPKAPPPDLSALTRKAIDAAWSHKTPAEVVSAVAGVFCVTPDDLKYGGNEVILSMSRAVAAFLMVERLKFPTTRAATETGYLSHASVGTASAKVRGILNGRPTKWRVPPPHPGRAVVEIGTDNRWP